MRAGGNVMNRVEPILAIALVIFAAAIIVEVFW